MASKISITVLLFLCLGNFAVAQKRKPTLKQGVVGTVIWKAGNLQPTPDAKVPMPKGTPVVREVYVYALTNQKQAESAESVFYKNLQTKLVAKAKSDVRGRFKIRLRPGFYSIFSKESKGLYANQFDDAMNLFPVEVRRGKFSSVELVIDYEAVY